MSPVHRDQLLRTRAGQWDDLRSMLLAYADHSPVRRVAVVGNAPLEPDPARAAEIDAADLVIRANAMVLDDRGDLPTVGTRCHVVLLSRRTRLTPWALRDYRDRLYLVPQAGFVEYHPGDEVGLLLETPFWPEDLGAVPLPNAVVKARAVQALDPGAAPGAVIPTTGTMGVFMAHEMFPEAEVVIAGFSFLDDVAQTHWDHHSGARVKLNTRHQLDLEARLLHRWIDDGTVRRLS